MSVCVEKLILTPRHAAPAFSVSKLSVVRLPPRAALTMELKSEKLVLGSFRAATVANALQRGLCNAAFNRINSPAVVVGIFNLVSFTLGHAA